VAGHHPSLGPLGQARAEERDASRGHALQREIVARAEDARPTHPDQEGGVLALEVGAAVLEVPVPVDLEPPLDAEVEVTFMAWLA